MSVVSNQAKEKWLVHISETTSQASLCRLANLKLVIYI
jgi:hypothetical protein